MPAAIYNPNPATKKKDYYTLSKKDYYTPSNGYIKVILG